MRHRTDMAAHSRSPGVGLCSQLKHCAWTHVRPGTVLKQCPSSVNLLGWRQAGSKSRGTGVPGAPQRLLTRSRLRRQVCSCRATQKGSAGAPSTTLGTSPQGPGAAVSTAQPSAQPAAVAPPPLQLDASGAPIASSAADFALTAQQLRQLIEANLSSSSSSTTTGVAGEATTQEGHLDVEAIAAGVCSSTATGLSGEPGDVALRRRLYGANALPPAAASSLWQLILEAASDTTLLLLLAAGGVSLGLSAARAAEIADWIDGAAILASVGICVAVTAGTNYNKEAKFRALNALKEDVQVRVVRQGAEASVSCHDLLVGDVVLLEAGDILPADGLLLPGGSPLRVDESQLTGESDDVLKSYPAAPVLVSGSKVRDGFGRMLVLAVGPNSQQGLINTLVLAQAAAQAGAGGAGAEAALTATLAADAAGSPAAAAAVAAGAGVDGDGSAALRAQTPLGAKLEVLAGQIGNVGMAAAGGVLAINAGLFTVEQLRAGLPLLAPDALERYLDFLITSITLLVVAVPEGLPLAVTLALAFSVQRMLADNNLVRHLDACETMATATTICSDKTGTLTENNMRVVRCLVGGAAFTVRPSAAGAVSCAIPLPGVGSSSSLPADPCGTLAFTDYASTSDSSGASSLQSRGWGGRGDASPQPDLEELPLEAGNSSRSSSRSRSSNGRAAPSVLPTSNTMDTAGVPAPASTGDATSSSRGQGEVALSSQGAPAAAEGRPLGAALTRVSLSWDEAGDPWPWGSPVMSRDLGEEAADAAAKQRQLAALLGGSSNGASLVWGEPNSMDGWHDPGEIDALVEELSARLAAAKETGSNGAEDAAGTSSSSSSSSNGQHPPSQQQQASAAQGRLAASSKQQPDQQAAAAAALQSTPTSSSSSSAASSVPGSNGSTLSMTATTSLDEGAGPALSPAVQDLLVDNIGLNSTASIRLDPGSRALDRAGNRTECALLEFAGRLQGRLLEREQLEGGPGRRVLKVYPFSSERKAMSVVVATGAPLPPGGAGSGAVPGRAYVKGAAELLLDRCKLQVGLDGRLAPLSPGQRAALKARCGAGGLRVLALAYKDLLLAPAASDAASSSSSGEGSGAATPGSSRSGPRVCVPGVEEVERDLVLTGLLGLEDPVRPEVPGAIADCQRAGIRVVMITGDNATTATSIAQQCGILPRPGATSSSSSSSSPLGPLPAAGDTSASAPASANLSSSSSSGQVGTAAAPEVVTVSASSSGGAPWTLERVAASGSGPLVLEGPVFRELVTRSPGTNGTTSPGSPGGVDLEAFLALWPRLAVMARCSPADKFLLMTSVKALREQGRLPETVAMTGDGTNDAPALSAADVGFAMNSGTAIAKDAADILLMDDNFRSIVSAVRWGRNVYASVTKFLQFQLTANLVAVVTAAGGALLLRESPLSAVQMLWVNLIMDSLASLALATEPPAADVLDEPPLARDAPLVPPTVLKSILGQGVWQLGVMAALLGPLGDTLAAGDRGVQYTLLFNTFVLMQLFNQVAMVQAGGRAFSTVPLTGAQWALCTAAGATTLLVRQALRLIPTEPPRGHRTAG